MAPGLWASRGARNRARKRDKLVDSELRHVLAASVPVTRSGLVRSIYTYTCLCVCVPMSSKRTMTVSRAGPGIGEERSEKDTIAPIPALHDRFHPSCMRHGESAKRSINRILLPEIRRISHVRASPPFLALSAGTVSATRRSVFLVRNRTGPSSAGSIRCFLKTDETVLSYFGELQLSKLMAQSCRYGGGDSLSRDIGL